MRGQTIGRLGRLAMVVAGVGSFGAVASVFGPQGARAGGSILAEPSAEQGVIGTLEGRRWRVEIVSPRWGTRYRVIDSAGRVVAEAESPGDLQLLAPGLDVESMVADAPILMHLEERE